MTRVIAGYYSPAVRGRFEKKCAARMHEAEQRIRATQKMEPRQGIDAVTPRLNGASPLHRSAAKNAVPYDEGQTICTARSHIFHIAINMPAGESAFFQVLLLVLQENRTVFVFYPDLFCHFMA